MSDNNTNTEEPTFNNGNNNSTEELEEVAGALRWCLERHDENRKEVQERLHKLCKEWREKADDLEERTICDLEKSARPKPLTFRTPWTVAAKTEMMFC